jgi:transposase-like protein
VTQVNRTPPQQQESQRPPRAKRHTWSPAEELELAELYGTVPAANLASRYGVSDQQLRDKASHMGITNRGFRGRPRTTRPEPETVEQTTHFGKQTVTTTEAARIITHVMR